MFLSALLSASLAAPVPKAKPAAPYFPTSVGVTRVMQIECDGRTRELTEEVTAVEETADTRRVTIEYREGKPTFRMVYEVTADTVVQTGVARCTFFDRTIKVGDNWTYEPRKGAVCTFTVGEEEEEVEVPAGKFKAIPVTERTPGGDLNTTWYAPGVGVVKFQSRGSAERTDVLKSFTPGKAKAEEKKDK